MGASGLLIAMAIPWALPAMPADPLGDVQRAADQASAAQQAGVAGDATCGVTELDAIIVCGRRSRTYRPVYPPEPGARRHLIAGEAPSGAAALNADECHRLCHRPVRVELFRAARRIAGLLGRIVE